MKRAGSRAAAAVAMLSVTAVLAVGCQSTPESSIDEDAPVTITVGDFPRSDQPELVELWTDQIAAFEKANPNIKVETDTYVFAADTFAAAFEGDTLPTVFYIPFTEPQGLLREGKIANITDAVEEAGLRDKLDENLLSKMSDADGEIYGLPQNAYSVGLIYNRGLFEDAGLDPDQPPATFEELRAAAKQITDATGVPGFGMMGSGQGGGWSLTALTYAFGGLIQNAEGTESALEDGGTQAALETLQGMRQDGSLSENVLVDFGSFATEFAAERYAMMIGCPCWYPNVVDNGFPVDDFGSTTMPETPDANATLAGGAVQAVNVNATPEQALAAVKWVEFFYLSPQLEEEAAVTRAKADNASGAPVGIPMLPLFSPEQTEDYYSWIEPWVNVPVEQFAPWERIAEQDLVAEPAVKAQDTYTLLDGLVQKVISDPDADVPALVADYNEQLNTLLSR